MAAKPITTTVAEAIRAWAIEQKLIGPLSPGHLCLAVVVSTPTGSDVHCSTFCPSTFPIDDLLIRAGREQKAEVGKRRGAQRGKGPKIQN